jgi:hypothetical protein
LNEFEAMLCKNNYDGERDNREKVAIMETFLGFTKSRVYSFFNMKKYASSCRKFNWFPDSATEIWMPY